jgi:hypothetical protein
MGDRILAGKLERKTSLGRHRCNWKLNFTRNLYNLDGGMDWIDVAQDRDR